MVLYERIVTANPLPRSDSALQLDAVTAASPEIGCRLIRLILDRMLTTYRQKLAEHETRTGDDPFAYLVSSPSLHRELDGLNNHVFGNAMTLASAQEPAHFLEALLPWIEQVLGLGPGTDRDVLCSRETSFKARFMKRYLLLSIR